MRIQPRFLSCEQEEAGDMATTRSPDLRLYLKTFLVTVKERCRDYNTGLIFPTVTTPRPPSFRTHTHTRWRTWKSRRIFLIHTPSGLLSYRSNTSVMRLADRHWLSKSVVPLLQAWWLSPTASRASLPRYLFSQSGGGWGISLPPPCSSPPTLPASH